MTLHDLREFNVACRSEATVLITGPTGCGKSRLAQQIHERSARSSGPFIVVNLASLHEGTLESELFGHEKGAFTSAANRRVGRIELASGGTLFLDEIGELSQRLQARLLEFLQSRTLTPVGGNRTSKVDVRVIAATHRNLADDVGAGVFREDLFHRLRIISLGIPALIERPEDFDTILHSCLAEVAAQYGRTLLRLSEAAAVRLESHNWPGNIRELRNVLEYALLAADGDEILLADLPSWLSDKAQLALAAESEAKPTTDQRARILAVAEIPMTYDYHASLAHFERKYLEKALKSHSGRINLTAREIGLNKTTLIRRLRHYGIHPRHSPDSVQVGA